MEPAKIDWNNIQSIFVQDDLYEYISAPKWIDFSAPDDSVDDEAWFCKPDCRHPKTAEDFLVSTPNSKVKHVGSAKNSEILPLGDRNCRDANLKRRLVISSSMLSNNEANPRFQEDGENENPNLHTPPPLPPATNHLRKQVKAAIKSSSEKKKPLNQSPLNSSQEDRQPQLKNALSARNLGKEIFNQITEICHELKKLTLRLEEKENSETAIPEASATEKEKKKPLLEAEKGNCREAAIKKKKEDISVDLKESLLQVRTNPPTPQCFSATRRPLRTLKTTTALNPSTTPLERGILQEAEQNNRVATKEYGEKGNRNISLVGADARSLDMFWFLKPCTFLAK